MEEYPYEDLPEMKRHAKLMTAGLTNDINLYITTGVTSVPDFITLPVYNIRGVNSSFLCINVNKLLQDKALRKKAFYYLGKDMRFVVEKKAFDMFNTKTYTDDFDMNIVDYIFSEDDIIFNPKTMIDELSPEQIYSMYEHTMSSKYLCISRDIDTRRMTYTEEYESSGIAMTSDKRKLLLKAFTIIVIFAFLIKINNNRK